MYWENPTCLLGVVADTGHRLAASVVLDEEMWRLADLQIPVMLARLAPDAKHRPKRLERDCVLARFDVADCGCRKAAVGRLFRNGPCKRR